MSYKKQRLAAIEKALHGDKSELDAILYGNRINVTRIKKNENGTLTLTTTGMHLAKPIVKTVTQKQYEKLREQERAQGVTVINVKRAPIQNR